MGVAVRACEKAQEWSGADRRELHELATRFGGCNEGQLNRPPNPNNSPNPLTTHLWHLLCTWCLAEHLAAKPALSHGHAVLSQSACRVCGSGSSWDNRGKAKARENSV